MTSKKDALQALGALLLSYCPGKGSFESTQFEIIETFIQQQSES